MITTHCNLIVEDVSAQTGFTLAPVVNRTKKTFWSSPASSTKAPLLRQSVRLVAAAFLVCLVFPVFLLSQTEFASLVGTVRDAQGAAVASASVKVIRLETGVVTTTVTNGVGLYAFPGLQPGDYHIAVIKPGFKEDVVEGLLLSVQDRREQNFTLRVGSVSETVNVDASAEMINTQDASVSTVVDRQFAENLPLNGRSFQTLINLTPGVVVAAANGDDSGQFNVNGQRAASNYWMVDGVSANVGSSAYYGGNQASGAIGTTSVLGGTNSLVSVDAMQEFRIQTSTFAPEFGRTPGGQISIVTRSGTNKFHGSLFDYLRNDVLDANYWFNGVNIENPTPLPKPEERQNDFGGTFSGPLWKDKTFFFFSYEGLRLRLPQTTISYVPDASFTPGTTNSRQNAIPAMQPYLNVFPLPNANSPEILCNPTSDPFCPSSGLTGSAAFNASYSNPATLNAYSLRLDHRLNDKVSFFARYNYSPSSSRQRGDESLNNVSLIRSTVQTTTAGITWAFSPRIADDFRFNYSRTNAGSSGYLDNFGGGIPLQTLPFPTPYTQQNASFSIALFNSLGPDGWYDVGPTVGNLQRQFNVVDNVSIQKGSHLLKFGFDYRRLSPQTLPFQYGLGASFDNIPYFANGILDPVNGGAYVQAQTPNTFLFHNVSAFAQDTWKINSRLNLTYGLRWDTDFAPETLAGPNITGLTGFNLNNLANLALAPSATPPFKTTYGNLAPRVGVAYQLAPSANFATVLRGGFGIFYDLATSEVANIVDDDAYPFVVFQELTNISFPINPPPALPQIPLPSATAGVLGGFDPNLKLPFTLQWNISMEQGLGSHQTFTASYVGASGRRLLQSAYLFQPNPQINQAVLTANTGSSDYDALQLQFNRSLKAGLQALVSYTWSHSIDTASAGSTYNGTNAIGPGANQNANRGDSDFDIRNSFSAALTYAIPSFKSQSLLKAVSGGWSLESIILARSAPPVTVVDNAFYTLSHVFYAAIRPDVTPGIPVYLYGSQYPGGKAINNTPGAVPGGCSDGTESIGPFCGPPTDANGNPLRQGDLGRNSLRGFGATQIDFAVHRDFPLHEALKLQFRAEMFNVFNHPNFAPPDGGLYDTTFGLSTELLGQYLNGGVQGGSGLQGSGGFSQLYQIGGPRSIQVALKFLF